MNIHEYQAKKLFRLNGVPVPDGYLAQSGTEAEFAMHKEDIPLLISNHNFHSMLNDQELNQLIVDSGTTPLPYLKEFLISRFF